jgi:hypothetical protein
MLFLLAGSSGTTAEEDLFNGAPDPSAKLGAGTSHGRVTLRTPPRLARALHPARRDRPRQPGRRCRGARLHGRNGQGGLDAYLGAPLGTSTVKGRRPCHRRSDENTPARAARHRADRRGLTEYTALRRRNAVGPVQC